MHTARLAVLLSALTPVSATSDDETRIPHPLIEDVLAIEGAKVESGKDAGYIAALEYIKALTSGELQTVPMPVGVPAGIPGFADGNDRLWEIRFLDLEHEALGALIFVNAETGEAKIMCNMRGAKSSWCPKSKDTSTSQNAK